jgi:DNA-binding FadR family transcriptional regulator
VASDLRRRPLRIDPNRVTRIRDIVEIMQVRLGLEVEAAGLAAGSRASEQLRRIKEALNTTGKVAQKRSSSSKKIATSQRNCRGRWQSLFLAVPRIPRALHHSERQHQD